MGTLDIDRGSQCDCCEMGGRMGVFEDSQGNKTVATLYDDRIAFK